MTIAESVGPRVALVTGGAGDIGLASERLLGAQGLRIVVADRVGADAAAAQLCEEGLDAYGVELDVTSEDAWAKTIGVIQQAHGGLDVLINAAGIEGEPGPLWEQSVEAFESVMRVNATGTFLALRACLPLLCARAGARAIVNVASTAGILGLPGMAPYVASKHAVVGLTRAAASEAARWGICVNAVCPGPTSGRMIESIERGVRPADPGRVRAIYEAAIPLKRYGHPSEIAAIVAFLASPAASYLTGAIIPVDGGMSAA